MQFIPQPASVFSQRQYLLSNPHAPVVRPIGGVTYFNCGDWVESCSALVEHHNGHMELLTGLHTPSRAIPLPPMGSFEEFEEVGKRMQGH